MQHNLHGGLLSRVREVNRFESTEETDVFKYAVVKEHAGALTVSDMHQFIEWMLNATPLALESKGKFNAKFFGAEGLDACNVSRHARKRQSPKQQKYVTI